MRSLNVLNQLHRLRPGPRTGWGAAVVALVWLAVTGVQHLRGWPGWTLEIPVKTTEIRPEPKRKGVWKAPVPSRYRSWLTDHRGVLREDGLRVGRHSTSISRVLKETGGIFVISNAFVRWRTADGTDPRKSGRNYSLEIPAPLPPWTWGAGLGLLAWAWTARRRPEPAPAGVCRRACRLDLWGAAAFMLAAGGMALSRVPDAALTNDGAMMIKGLPYSDAACWYEMSVSLAEGRGLASAFDGQRPWYSVMIAMVHMVRGLAVENGLVVNALALGLASGLLYLTGRLLGSRTIGVGAASVLMLSHQNCLSAAALLTETSGLALTVLSLALVLMAVSALPQPGRPRWLWVTGLGLGGLFQALGNLTCPYTLVAVPFYGLLLLAEGRRTLQSGPPVWWKNWRVLRPGLIYAAGFLIVLAPWIVRQQQVHGLATLSTQTADLLYGATFEEGPMKPRQMRELHDHLDQTGYTVEAKYRFSMKRYLETVGQDPWLYLQRLGAGGLAFFGYFNVTSPEPAAAAVLTALAVMWHRRREPGRLAWLVAGAGVAAAAVYFIRLPSRHGDPLPLLGLTIGAAILAWWLGPRRSRTGVLWIAATLSGCVLINALTGNAIASRCWIFCGWCLWLLVLAAVHGTTDRLGSLLARAGSVLMRRPADSTGNGPVAGPDYSGLRQFITAAALLVVTVQAVGAGVLLFRQARPVEFSAAPAPEDLARAQAWASSFYAAKEKASGYPLQFLWARAGEGACFLEKQEEATRFSRAFARKSWPRTLRLMRGVPAAPGQAAPGWMVRVPGDARSMPEDRPGLLVAWLSVDKKANLGHDEEIYEVLAFLPGDAAGAIHPDQAILYHVPLSPGPVPQDAVPPASESPDPEPGAEGGELEEDGSNAMTDPDREEDPYPGQTDPP